MGCLFKFRYIGVVVGGILGRLPGAIIGYIIGACIDAAGTMPDPRLEQTQGSTPAEGNKAYNEFVYNLVYLCADVIFADGRIYQSETDMLHNFLLQSLGANDAQKGMRYFEQMKTLRRTRGVEAWNASIQNVCQSISKLMPEAARIQMVAFLAELSKADGCTHQTEIKSIRRIAFHLGLDATIVDQMLALGGQSLDAAYQVLGLTPQATDDDVRRAYKKMVLQHHPDRVAHLGEEVKKAATKKMQEINKAKDAIFAARNMK